MATRFGACLVMLTLLVFSVSCSSISDSNELLCSKKVIDTCLIPLKEVNYEVANAVVPHFSKETLRDHCRRYTMFESCMEEVRPYCSVTQQLIYKGIEDAYRWMCRDGFNEYLTYSECFNNKQLHRDGDTCNNTLTQNLATLKQTFYTDSQKTKYICFHIEQYLDCVQSVVQKYCGKDAALWQRTLDEKSLVPILDAINCKITITQKSKISTYWIPIAIGVSLSLSLLIIFMAILLLYLQRRRRRQPATSQINLTAPMAPPPYEEPLPFTLYSGYDGIPLATEAAGPIPNKANPSSYPIQVPPYPEDGGVATQSQQSSNYEAVDAGYFGASASGVDVPQEKQVKAEETNDKPESDLSALHRNDNPNPEVTGLSNPAFDDLGAVGYFGATVNKVSAE